MVSDREDAEQAWEHIATRINGHPLERIGRRVFAELSDEQWVEVLAAVCRHNGRNKKDRIIPDLLRPKRKIIQDDAAIFPAYALSNVGDGVLIVEPIKNGFKCTWKARA